MDELPPDRTVEPGPRVVAEPDPEALAGAYHRIVTDLGVLDRSASGKLALTGTEAAEFLNGQVTADVLSLEPGHGTYAALLTPKGKILTDLRILAIDHGDGGAGEAQLLLLCERSGLQALFDHLRRHLIGFNVELHKRTLQQTLLSVVGPRAQTGIGAAATALGDAEHDHVATTVDDIPVRLIRTDVGVELLADADHDAALGTALDRRGAEPIPDEAVEIVRVETGRPRLHHEMDDAVMPAEVGIVDRAVSFTKGCYVGQETVARLHWRGRPNRHLRGLLLDRAVPAGTVLVEDGRELGRVTTGVHSPRFGPIALALVRREVEPGQTVAVRPSDGGPTTARVVSLPFAEPGSRTTA